MSVVLLSSFGSGGLFESSLVFAVILISSLLFAFIAKSMNFEPFRWISGKFELSDWKWIGIGYLGLLGIVFITTSIIPGSAGILIALGIGGLLLAYVLIKTETVLAPIISHFAYNMTVLILASNYFGAAIPLSASPLFIPTFGFGLNDLNSLGTQAFLQFAFVAAGEESMKVSLALGVSMLISKDKRVMFILAVALWGILHAILSFRLS